MDNNTRQTLVDKMYETIKEESLIVPTRILIRQPSQGKQRRGGTTIKSRHFNNNFRLTVTVTTPKYTQDPNGKYWQRSDKSIRFRCDGWHEVSKERVLEIAAHEMAHLKFWNHDAEHASYTKYLYDILIEKLKEWNCDKSGHTC
jgi:hypothetical protein